MLTHFSYSVRQAGITIDQPNNRFVQINDNPRVISFFENHYPETEAQRVTPFLSKPFEDVVQAPIEDQTSHKQTLTECVTSLIEDIISVAEPVPVAT